MIPHEEAASGPGAFPPPLSLYIHIPWCVRKCPYCDFNSHNLRGTIPEIAYVDALLCDLDRDLASLEPEVQPLVAVFIGGGTPSLLSGAAIGQLLDGIRQRLPLPTGTEITLEANPGTADAGNFEAYREAGVNRLSLGFQSLNGRRLADLGRIHGPAEARQAFRLARQAGFDNLNLDLMFALPGQDLDQARADLSEALALEPEHLSYYQLTLEPNTPFHLAPPPLLPDEDLAMEMQLRGLELLTTAGFAQYEVSAHARPGRRCQHNLNYWTFGDYLGIGAGAHGKLTDLSSGVIRRTAKPRHPDAYLQPVGAVGPSLASSWLVEPDDIVLEFAMNALRLTAGFDLGLFQRRTGLATDLLLSPLLALQGTRLVEVREQWIRPTEQGRWFLNDLLALFLPD